MELKPLDYIRNTICTKITIGTHTTVELHIIDILVCSDIHGNKISEKCRSLNFGTLWKIIT